MRGLAIARVARDHPVIVHGVHVALSRVRSIFLRHDLQPRVDRLALEREHAEHALVHAIERFALDEAM